MIVNLYSDTQTKPTVAMRRAMAEAEVGDEQRGEDPSTNAIQERVADLLGHESALFLPSGTMCNLIALRLHVRPSGDEVLLGEEAHPLRAEAGGPATICGAVMTVVRGEHGIYGPDELTACINSTDRMKPCSRVVSVEQPTNTAGGRIWPLARIQEIVRVARDRGLRTHLDGARLPNAVVATGVPAATWAADFDTAWIDFSKGLGAPVGACLAGSHTLIEEAWRYKQMFGGAMRQSGVLAAAALYALDHHWDRLDQDHLHADRLAKGLAHLRGVTLDPAEVDTNIVIWKVPDARAFVASMKVEGVILQALDAHRVRAVTHLDVGEHQIDRALVAAERVLSGAALV